MRNEIRKKIIVTVLIVFMIVSAIPVHTYAGGNQKVYNNNNGSEIKSSAGVYEDNAYFSPVRYTITKNACVRLLNASSLSASRKIIVPRTHFIVFNNLKGYYVKSGGSTSDFDYWKKISTDGFV